MIQCVAEESSIKSIVEEIGIVEEDDFEICIYFVFIKCLQIKRNNLERRWSPKGKSANKYSPVNSVAEEFDITHNVASLTCNMEHLLERFAVVFERKRPKI